MDQFIPRVVASLNDKGCSAQMKIDTLAFLTQTLISHNPNVSVPLYHHFYQITQMCSNCSFMT